MDALENILSRNSPRALAEPCPSKLEMEIVYKAALRAPDHAWLRPSRFIEVRGNGLKKLSDLYVKFAKENFLEVTDLQLEKYQAAPFRAPMIVVLVSKVTEHPKVPELEQMLSTAAAAENMLLALHAQNFAGMWRTGKLALNDKLAEYFDLSPDHKILGYLYIGTPAGDGKKIPDLELENFVSYWD
mgnify:CR=1 FL=1